MESVEVRSPANIGMSINRPTKNNNLLAIAVVGSPLQYAVFNKAISSVKASLIIGNRGMHGDQSYSYSVLNNHRFIEDLDRLIGSRLVEVFLPNSLNALYFFCLAHPRVLRISFLDEGRLTKRFLEGGLNKPTSKLSYLFKALYRAAWPLKRFHKVTYRILGVGVQRLVVRRYEKDTMNFPFRTLETRWKAGTILTHIEPRQPGTSVEVVNLTESLKMNEDLPDSACLFIHPKDASTPSAINRVCQCVERTSRKGQAFVLRPHPLFETYPEKLAKIKRFLSNCDVRWVALTLSEKHETAMELYARGVRLFLMGNSSLEDTIAAYPSFFRELRVVKF